MSPKGQWTTVQHFLGDEVKCCCLWTDGQDVHSYLKDEKGGRGY